jgi:hypothetical protein
MSLKHSVYSSDNDTSAELAIELIDILYRNTGLNYDACANNLVELFEHIQRRLPPLNSFSQTIISAAKVIIYL